GAITHQGAVIWDVETCSQVGRVRGNENTLVRPLASMRFDDDLRTVALVADREKGVVEVRALDENAPRPSTVETRLPGVELLGFVDEGRALAVAGPQKRVEVWDVAEGRRRGFCNSCTTLRADGKLAVVARPRRLDVVDLATHRIVRELAPLRPTSPRF